MSDEDEFTALFRRHYPRVLAFVSRRTDQARAHDVVAETFATAWRHFARLPAEPLPWLYRVARNSLANEERAARRQSRLAERIARRGVRGDARPRRLGRRRRRVAAGAGRLSPATARRCC